MNNVTEIFTPITASLLLFMTPTFFIQGVMILLICFLIWVEYFSKNLVSRWYDHITIPISGIMAAIMFYYAPIIQTHIGWSIAFITYIIFVFFVMKLVIKKIRTKRGA